jgi:hypothetical protein
MAMEKACSITIRVSIALVLGLCWWIGTDAGSKSKRYLRWQRRRLLNVWHHTPDACPAHAGEPLSRRIDIIFDLKAALIM